MYISSLTLTNFRNYTAEKIKFSPLTNVIYGSNAQGKTNILEAVYIFAQGRSHRAKSDREMIKFGEDFSRLSLDFQDLQRSYSASARFVRNGKKSIKINHVQITKLSMLMNYLNAVMFSPEDLDLVKGSPSARRRFMDSSISQLYPRYLTSLIDYHKALAQKNSLLKDLKYKGARSDMMLSVWNERLACEGARIMEYRRDFVKLMREYASVIQYEISGERLEIEYSPGIKSADTDSTDILEYLERHQRREIDAASALFGVQRDDLAVRIDSREARVYGSQGQQRTAALAMKISQADYIHSIKGEYPILLLDDIMSELDVRRRAYLAQKIRDKQVLITSTDTDLMKSTEDTRLIHVSNGTVLREG